MYLENLSCLPMSAKNFQSLIECLQALTTAQDRHTYFLSAFFIIDVCHTLIVFLTHILLPFDA